MKGSLSPQLSTEQDMGKMYFYDLAVIRGIFGVTFYGVQFSGSLIREYTLFVHLNLMLAICFSKVRTTSSHLFL